MTAPETLTLSAWLLERIDDDQRTAENALMRRDVEVEDDEPWRLWWQDVPSRLCVQPARVLAQCAAYRQIVEGHDDAGCLYCPEIPEDCPTLRALASIYAGEPGWREEWAL